CLLRLPDASTQRVQRIERLLPGRSLVEPQEFPGRRQDRNERAHGHRRQKNRVAPLVQKTQAGAVIELGGAGVDRKRGARIGIGRFDFLEQRLLIQQVTASVHERSREGRDDVIVQLAGGGDVERDAQRRQVFIRDRRRAPQCSLRQVKAFVSAFIFG